jgi:pimeloyl-ACP methyl ester carboxylesterase
MSTELLPMTQADKPPQRLEVSGGWLAYHHTPPKDPQAARPGVVFLGGFKSDMTGTKATYLEEICGKHGLGYTRFDYMGHGQSSGDFEDGTIGQWAENAVAILDKVAMGPQLLIGSSMGGWMMLLAALKRPEQVRGLIGIAAAPDFTEDLIWEAFDDATKEALMRDGVIQMPNCYDDQEPYTITRQLIEEGRQHLLLKTTIPLDCPVTLLQGMRDDDVPWHVSVQLSEKLQSDTVQVCLFKDGDHRMSDAPKLAAIEAALLEMQGQKD